MRKNHLEIEWEQKGAAYVDCDKSGCDDGKEKNRSH